MSTDTNAVPLHLGLIMDGNRRWARDNGKSVEQGHREGYKNLKTICRSAFTQGVQYVSAYAFSTENWSREKQEVTDLMNFTKWVLKHEVKEFQKDNIRLRVIGSKLKLGSSLLTAIHDAEKLTENNTRGTLLICFDYGGQQEIIDAVKKIVAKGTKAEDVTTQMIEANLYASDVPPLDLIIRTSGKQRLSNFMTWESVYSELLFVKKNWPEFDEQDLEKAIVEYGLEKRTFGV